MALYSRPAVPSRGLYGLLLVGPKGILLVVFFWGVWHGLMQTYGFCRIYDAKTGTFDALTAAARFRDVRNLVRHGGSTFTIPAERYARYRTTCVADRLSRHQSFNMANS